MDCYCYLDYEEMFRTDSQGGTGFQNNQQKSWPNKENSETFDVCAYMTKCHKYLNDDREEK